VFSLSFESQAILSVLLTTYNLVVGKWTPKWLCHIMIILINKSPLNMAFKEDWYFFTKIYGCKFNTNGLNNQSMGKACNTNKGSVNDIKCSPFNLEDL
jgi:hypothetical protein